MKYVERQKLTYVECSHTIYNIPQLLYYYEHHNDAFSLGSITIA